MDFWKRGDILSSITRSEQKPEDCWDLSKLFKKPEDWETAFALLPAYAKRFASFQGRLSEGPRTVLAFLELSTEHLLLNERVGHYAFLRMSEDAGDASNQERMNRFTSVINQNLAAMSFFDPELLSLPQPSIDALLTDPSLEPWRIMLQRTVRAKPHVRSAEVEEALALGNDAARTPHSAFSALTDVDMEWGSVETSDGPVTLTHGTYLSLMQKPDRALREKVWRQYYHGFWSHRNTLAALYAGSVRRDVYEAKISHHPDSLSRALFPDNIDLGVYTQLVATVREHLPLLHRYYHIRKKALGLSDLASWDTRVNLVPDITWNMPYAEAVETAIAALAPLGPEYIKTLSAGLHGRWVDRYENKGKRSGAFSAGSYQSDPYILMNYKDDSPRDVFTLVHEAGHSMHSHYSAANNPVQHYNYTIFEAEVASTFNEQLLGTYLAEKHAGTDKELYLLDKQVDDILSTIFRQTMFAEYELICHNIVEQGESLDLGRLLAEYRKLLSAYFGPDVVLPSELDVEGLRIPHFYRAFYVYQYATGLSAAIALSRGVLSGGEKEREAYFRFLKSGGSRFPIESLRIAGVDMSRSEPVHSAMQHFSTLLDRLETGLEKRGIIKSSN